MKQLRPYQQKLIDISAKKAGEVDRILIQAPTGAGKSLIMAEIAQRNIRAGRTILVISETRKIYDQLVVACNGVEINADVKHLYVHEGRCYVAMCQTLIRRPLILKQFTEIGENLTVMTDEAHIGTPNTLLDILLPSNPIMLGLTATPHFKFAKHLPKYYNECIPGPEVLDLINDGYLCNYRHIERQRPEIEKELDKKGGEYTEESQDRFFSKTELYTGLIEDLNQFYFLG